MTHAAQPRLRHVQCLDARGLHRMAYWEWGDPANRRVLVCVHGLTRQGRDFDTLAQALMHHYRVVCPDIVGRGESDRLADPMGYGVPTYVADIVTLLARLDADTLHWVGTSMGGLIGMGVASLPGTPVHKLVLNDVGPTIEPAAVARIGSYVGLPVTWATVEEAADHLWTLSQGFGPHTREQWLALTRPQLRRTPDGQRWQGHYDPMLAVPFKAVSPEQVKAGESLLWKAYDAISCPTLLLRGAESDLLSRETALRMGERGPKAATVEFAGVGHAPMLVHPDQVEVVARFLLAP